MGTAAILHRISFNRDSLVTLFIMDLPVTVPVDNPNADTEWNDILRKHGIIPEKPKDPEPIIQEALLEAARKAHEKRLRPGLSASETRLCPGRYGRKFQSLRAGPPYFFSGDERRISSPDRTLARGGSQIRRYQILPD